MITESRSGLSRESTLRQLAEEGLHGNGAGRDPLRRLAAYMPSMAQNSVGEATIGVLGKCDVVCFASPTEAD